MFSPKSDESHRRRENIYGAWNERVRVNLLFSWICIQINADRDMARDRLIVAFRGEKDW